MNTHNTPSSQLLLPNPWIVIICWRSRKPRFRMPWWLMFELARPQFCKIRLERTPRKSTYSHRLQESYPILEAHSSCLFDIIGYPMLQTTGNSRATQLPAKGNSPESNTFGQLPASDWGDKPLAFKRPWYIYNIYIHILLIDWFVVWNMFFLVQLPLGWWSTFIDILAICGHSPDSVVTS